MAPRSCFGNVTNIGLCMYMSICMYIKCVYRVIVVYLLEKKNIKNYNNTIYHLIPLYAYLYSYTYILKDVHVYIPIFDTFQKQEAGGTTNVLTCLYAYNPTIQLFDICL